MTQQKQTEKGGPDFMTALTVASVLGLAVIATFRPQIRAAIDIVSPYIGVTIVVAGILIGAGYWATQAKTVNEAKSRSGLLATLISVGVVVILAILVLAHFQANFAKLMDGWK